MRRASRHRARSKRSGLRCQAPAVRGIAYAGCTAPARGGAPEGNRNALETRRQLGRDARRKEVQALARIARETLAAIEWRDAEQLTFARRVPFERRPHRMRAV